MVNISRSKGGNIGLGACLCGAVRYEFDVPLKFVAHCHCENCRRAHGAAFVTWAGVPHEAFRMISGEDQLKRYATETQALRSFCGTCGSTLFYESPRWADEKHMVLANLEECVAEDPKAHYYVDSKASWWEIQDDLPQHGGVTGVEPKDEAEKRDGSGDGNDAGAENDAAS